MIKDVRSYLALLTSLIAASLISFALGVTSTLWYLHPVLPGGPMTVASAPPGQDMPSALPPESEKTGTVPRVATASTAAPPSPKAVSPPLPSNAGNVPHNGEGGAKVAIASDEATEAAAEPASSATHMTPTAEPASPAKGEQRPPAEVATASSSPAPPASSQSTLTQARSAAPVPSPGQSAPPGNPTQVASTGNGTDGTSPVSPIVRRPVFQLQLGSFLNTANAHRFQKELNQQGFPVKVSPIKDRQGRVWRVARMGAYSDRLTAVEAAARFRRDTGLDAIVMRKTPIDQG